MPFLYVYVCDLLESLSELVNRDYPILVGLAERANEMIVNWFIRHKRHLDEHSVDSAAVLFMFSPEKRVDRDYGFDAAGLEQLIARVFNVPRSLYVELQTWRNGPAHGDLGACVQRMMEKMKEGITDISVDNRATVEEIDRALLIVASHNPSSSLQVRSLAKHAHTRNIVELLGKIYRKLRPREAKWLTRFILKNYGEVQFPSQLNFSSSMAILPHCVRVTAAIPFTETCPVLRDAAREIRGSASACAPSLVPYTPSNTSVSAVGRVDSAAPRDNMLLTPQATNPRLSTPTVPASYIQEVSEQLKIIETVSFVSLAAGIESTSEPFISTPPSNPAQKLRMQLKAKLAAPPTSLAPFTVSTVLASTSAPGKSIRDSLIQSRAQQPSTRSGPISTTNNKSNSESLKRKVNEISSSMPLNTISGNALCSARTRDLEPPHSSLPTAHHMTASKSSPRCLPPSPTSSVPMVIRGTGTCQLSSSRCSLSDCIFLLAPCISSVPLITEKLLPWHGSRIVKTLKAFSDPSLPHRCLQTGMKYRKVALVESNQKVPTMEFLKHIEEFDLRRTGGNKQWVEVFDWRILEAMAKIDRGKELGYNPWRRCWIGAI